jgi:very-short-patch-repair endonuclease
VRRALIEQMARHGGLITRDQAARAVSMYVLDDAVRSGVVVRLFPRVFAFADARRADGIALHRRSWFRPEPPHMLIRNGLRVVRLEHAIIESWPLLPEIDRVVPALVAIRERRTTGERLNAALLECGRVPGAAAMRRLFGLAADGCHSALELWGHQNVFSHKSLPAARRQVPFDLPRIGRIYLDRYHEEEMVDVELDGAAFHGSPGQRERDLARDASLARLGIQTVRYSHVRLHRAPAGVRDELRAVLAVRRQQLGLARGA